jgi:hypothetical protein
VADARGGGAGRVVQCRRFAGGGGCLSAGDGQAGSKATAGAMRGRARATRSWRTSSGQKRCREGEMVAGRAIAWGVG